MSNNLPLPFAEVLEKNLVALGEKNPALEKELRQDWETSSIELIRCWDGKTLNLMFKLPLSDAKAFTAYDMHDPREPLAKAIANEGKRYENGVTIILGSGLGYVLREVLKQAEEGHHILVIEPDGFLLKTTLSLKDYSNKLREGSLSLCDGEAPSIVAAVGALENKISIEQPYIDSEPYTGFLKEVYGPVGEQTVKTLNQVRSNVSTVAQKGDEIIRNEYQSLPYIVRQKGIGELANAFTGKPFVIVSTGPSLGKNIHLLRDIQDKVIIFAVVQALKALLAYGVKPDAVCAIDYGELAKPHFEGILETHDIPFLALCRSRADMIRDYQGPILVSGTSYGDIDYYINNLWRIKGIINPGNSVAHFAFCAAHVLGGDPIILMGQDLALSSTSHFDQVDHNAAISLSAKGIQTVLSDKRSKYDGYQPAEEIPISIPGWYGAPVVTRAVLLGFLALFEQLVPLHNGTVINATEGGAYIKGAKHISLKAAARKYCKEPVDKALFANTTSAVNVDDLTQQVVERMTQEKELIDKMIELCQSALKANHQAGSLLDHAEKKGPTQDLADQITAALQTNFKLTSEAEQISKQHLPAMQMAMLGLDSKARSHIHKGSLNNADVLGSYKNPVKRNRMYLTEAIKQAKMLGKIYAQDLRIMNRFLKAKQALSDKPNSGKTLVDLSAALLGMGHFIEAKALLDNAREKLPKNLLILEALGKLCVKMELWEDYASVKLELGRLGSKSRKASQIIAAEMQKYRQALNRQLECNDKDFETGNFTRPLLYLDKQSRLGPQPLSALYADQLLRATKMRDNRIAQAEKAFAEEKKQNTKDKNIIQYTKLIQQSKDLGKVGKFERALRLVQKARTYNPDDLQGRWGEATCYHHLNRFDEALPVYRSMIHNFPGLDKLQFEYALLLLKMAEAEESPEARRARMVEAMAELGSVFVKSPQEYKWFYLNYAVLLTAEGHYREATQYCEAYLSGGFDFDVHGWEQLGKLRLRLGDQAGADQAASKYLTLKVLPLQEEKQA